MSHDVGLIYQVLDFVITPASKIEVDRQAGMHKYYHRISITVGKGRVKGIANDNFRSYSPDVGHLNIVSFKAEALRSTG